MGMFNNIPLPSEEQLKKLVEMAAKVQAMARDELIKNGFTREEAMELLKTGVVKA
jgi:hypothetical protein